MRKLFLIRHGESEWNIIKKIQGQKDTNLTEFGKTQAFHLANRLFNENIDIIYTSDLIRAYNTGKIISDIINKPLGTNKLLREIHFGKWEGLTSSQIKESYSQEFRTWINEPEKLQVEGGENLHMLKNRALTAIRNIFEMDDSKNIAIVSHSATLKTLILGLLEMDLSYYKRISLNNVSLSIIEFRDYNKVLTLLNDISHLQELKR